MAHLTHASVVCSTGGCETVQHSRYAELGGVPVALLGLLGYLAILGSAFLRRTEAAAVGAAVALGGLAFACWLVYVQLGILHAICVWCVASDVVLALLAVITTLRATHV